MNDDIETTEEIKNKTNTFIHFAHKPHYAHAQYSYTPTKNRPFQKIIYNEKLLSF